MDVMEPAGRAGRATSGRPWQWSLAGLGLWFGWTWSAFFSGTLVSAAPDPSSLGMTLFTWNLGVKVVVLAAASLSAARAVRVMQTVWALAAAAAITIVGTAMIGLAYTQQVVDPLWLAVAGTLVASSGHAAMALSCGEPYFQLRGNRAAAQVGVALMLGIATYFAVSAIPFAMPVILALPALTAAAAVWATNVGTSDSAPVAKVTVPLPRGFIRSLVLFAVACGYLVATAATAASADFNPYLFFGAAGIGVVLAVIETGVIGRRFSASRIYRLLFLLAVAGLLVALAQPLPDATLPASIVLAAWLGFECLFWTVVVSSSAPGDPVAQRRFFQFRMSAEGGLLVGMAAGRVAAALAGVWNVAKVVGLIVIVYALASAATAVLKNGGLPELREQPDPGAPIGPATQPLGTARLAGEHSLSPRECEILGLLAAGRSIPYIKAALFLSESTVKTHVRHIYAKLGVHTRQELLDAVESCSSKEPDTTEPISTTRRPGP